MFGPCPHGQMHCMGSGWLQQGTFRNLHGQGSAGFCLKERESSNFAELTRAQLVANEACKYVSWRVVVGSAQA